MNTPTLQKPLDPGLPVFLTAYDPSDLPGGSLDPLGFERGYLFLADKILPGLTNVADRPRYFSVLCVGASLAEVSLSDAPRRQYQKRLNCILRFERFWALANVLASQEATEGELPVTGIRGVTYAINKAESLTRKASQRVDANFPLLSRQIPYGVVGIYGAVADGLRLLDRKTLGLTPDLGERLAHGFRDETDVPATLAKAVREDGELPLSALDEWGKRAHISCPTLRSERICISESVNLDPVRSRMIEALRDHPFRELRETELQRFERLLPALSDTPSNRDLWEAVQAILAYEASYQLVALAFERILWLCRSSPAGPIRVSDLHSDPVLQLVCDRLPSESKRLGAALDAVQSEQFQLGLHRLDDTRRFLVCASAECGSPESLILEVVARHDDVQRGKFDRGRRKMPWLEVASGKISLTLTRVGGLDKQATVPADIYPHPYRLSSADSLIAAAGAA
jgi:hypothetical protein